MPRNVTVTVPAFPRVTDYAGPWAIEAGAAHALLAVASRTDLAAHVASAPRLRRAKSAIEMVPAGPKTATGGDQQDPQIAVIRASGVLMKQVSSLTGGTSTVQLRRDVRAAAADPAVCAILMVFDTPGGTVAGTSDLADDIRAAGLKKPVWAFAEDLCASAGYWLASQCARVVASNTGAWVGSIGALLAFSDTSRQATAAGVETLVFATGPYKGAGVAGSVVTADQRANFQDLIDQTQKGFDAAVTSGRKLSADRLAAVRTGQVWPADQALALGLVDAVQSIDQCLTDLARAGQAAKPAAKTGGKPTPGNGPTRTVHTPVPPHARGAMHFNDWCTARGFAPAALSPDLRAALELAYAENPAGPEAKPGAAGEVKPAATPAVVAPAVVDLAAERARIAAIEAAALRHPRASNVVAAKAVADGWTPERAELEMMRAGYTGNAVTPAAAGGAAQTAAVFEAALLLSACVQPERVAATVPAAVRDRVMEAALAPAMRGFGLQSLMYATLREAGVTYAGSPKSNGFLEAVKQADRQLSGFGGQPMAMTGGFSTTGLSGILGNVLNKVLLDAYTAIDTTWNKIAAVRSFNDFKPNSTYRLDTNGTFKKVGPAGELKSTQLTENGYQNQLDTFGTVIAITRQMIINDDLGALTQLPALMGRDAAVRLEEAVYVLLLSNAGAFFSAGNKNLVSGAGTDVSIAGYTAALTAFRNATNASGKPILMNPTKVLVPPGLYPAALQLYRGTTVEAAGTTDKVLASFNPHVGMFDPIQSPYLSNTFIRDQDGNAITGQSATAWYMLADPAMRAGLAVGFLNGQQTPIVESADTDFRTLGYQWRAYQDFGVGFEDVNAVLKLAGA